MSILIGLFLLAVGAAAQPAPHVVFVTGDHEYSSERTMPLLARQLETRYGLRTTVLKAFPDENSERDIPGLEALATADLAVFFLRWRALPQEQLRPIRAYLDSGRPVIGFRTSTHAFKYPPGDELEKWNDFGADVLGAPWITHHGHTSSTDVRAVAEAAGHPILTGVAGSFHVRSWLYQVRPDYPPRDATVLMMGHPVKSERKDPMDNPVAWTYRTRAGGRVFTTTLGHPEDFAVEAFQRLVVNAIYWALGRPAPERWGGRMPIDVAYEKQKKPAGG